MVVIATRGALQSDNVRAEVEVFPSNRRPLIPIVFDRATPSLTGDMWPQLIHGVAIHLEDSSSLESGTPSTLLLKRIKASVGNQRQSMRLRRVGIAVGAAVLVFLVALVVSGIYLSRTLGALSVAQERTLEATQTLNITVQQRDALENQTNKLAREADGLRVQIEREQERLRQARAETEQQSQRTSAQIAATEAVWKLVEQAGAAFQSQSPRFRCEDTNTSDVELFFAVNTYSPGQLGTTLLQQVASCLKQTPTVRVSIEGHEGHITAADVALAVSAPMEQTSEYGLAISERRADSVREYLVAAGVSSSRITTVAYGQERPRYGDDVDLLNNRVSIRFTRN
jgi:outer membrane protein OmpA-like peptidoglycan-associated protein